MKIYNVAQKINQQEIYKQSSTENKSSREDIFKKVLEKKEANYTKEAPQTKKLVDTKKASITSEKREESKDNDNTEDKEPKDIQALLNLAPDLNNLLQLLTQSKGSSSESQTKLINEILTKVTNDGNLLNLMNSQDESGDLSKLIELMSSMEAVNTDDISQKELLDTLKASLENVLDKKNTTNSSELLKSTIVLSSVGADNKAVKDDDKSILLAISPSSDKKVLENESSKNTSSEDTLNSKEDKILKSLIQEKDSGTSKAITFSEQLNRFKQDFTGKVSGVETPIVNKNNFANDVIKAVKYMDLNNIKELTVNINPRELGNITIKLTMEAGILKANIFAANKETVNLLNSHLNEIQKSVNSTEIKMQNVSVNIYNDDATFFSQSFNNNQGNFNGGNQQNSNRRKTHQLEEIDGIKTSSNSEIDSNISVLA